MRDREKMDLSSYKIFMCKPCRLRPTQVSSKSPSIWRLWIHCVWKVLPSSEFVFCPLPSCSALWDHKVFCFLERKSKYWIALTEVIVSPCLDTTSNCWLPTCWAVHEPRCDDCFEFGCIKWTALPDKIQSGILEIWHKSPLGFSFSLFRGSDHWQTRW